MSRLTNREQLWATLGALVPFAPQDPETQARVERGVGTALRVGRKGVRYGMPPLLAVILAVTPAIPLKASDAPAFAQRLGKWFMSEFPRDASVWIQKHSDDITKAAAAYKQYATAMRLYERVARARDIGFTLTFELPPVQLANDLGTGNSYDDVVIRPAGSPNLMVQKWNPKDFSVNFDFSALKSQLNGFLMGKWDIDYSRVTVGPDGQKTVIKDPGELAAMAKMTSVATWLLGNQKINAFPQYIDAGTDTRAKYDKIATDRNKAWNRRVQLRNRVQSRLEGAIATLKAKGSDASALETELMTLVAQRSIDEALVGGGTAGTVFSDKSLQAIKSMDAQGLALMEQLAANKFRHDMTATNQASTADALEEAAKQYNAKNSLSSLVSDISDLTDEVMKSMGLSFTHFTPFGPALEGTAAYAQVAKAIGDAVNAAKPENANREQLGNQMKSNAYLSGQEQHLAEVLRTLTGNSVQEQNEKIQELLQKRQAEIEDAILEQAEVAAEERNQEAIEALEQGLSFKPMVYGAEYAFDGRNFFPDGYLGGASFDMPTWLAMLNTPVQVAVVEGDACNPNDLQNRTESAVQQVKADFAKEASKQLNEVPNVFDKQLKDVNWKGYLGFLDPVIKALNKGISSILGKTFDLGDSDTYEKLRDTDTADIKV